MESKRVQKIGIILRPHSAHIKPIFLDIKERLDSAGIAVMLEHSGTKMLELDTNKISSHDMKHICEESDMLFSIGGDGTLLSVARRAYGHNIAILGINSGRLGYLTVATPNEIAEIIPRLKKGEYTTRNHLMLEGYVEESPSLETIQPLFALNEFLLSRAGFSGMLELEAYIDGMLFNHYRLDGLLVATPTGSSAYNISAGGSVVYPYCRNVLLTPICAHSLSQRPLILNDEFCIAFRFKTSGSLICDGQQRISIPQGSLICIKVAKYSAILTELQPNFYFIRLREKFGWGQYES
ncbi:NAD(+)/NADH kinase [Helicobacter aurati]|uniref:NAD kinase n=1 Tax=Helicobacter aurati TaxID=137778 RepID=A0A3D8J0P1_9HELI|nr:NAD(+)/NADH kinase [Helicobacter aurati]RDU70735.1 NAD(+)/NADH kinase [Helicobacter aurati]